jgi:hypothetical protein
MGVRKKEERRRTTRRDKGVVWKSAHEQRIQDERRRKARRKRRASWTYLNRVPRRGGLRVRERACSRPEHLLLRDRRALVGRPVHLVRRRNLFQVLDHEELRRRLHRELVLHTGVDVLALARPRGELAAVLLRQLLPYLLQLRNLRAIRRVDERRERLVHVERARLLRRDEPKALHDHLAKQLEDLVGLHDEILADHVLHLAGKEGWQG